MIAVSSGSTGKPAYWPRFVLDELAAAAQFEQIFHDSFEADRQPTLAVVCFPLGTWVGGLYTASCCRHLAAKGYPVTVPLAALGGGRGAHPLPFVYIFGRSHLAVSFFGANVYPENIAAGLEQPQIHGWVTGKFVLEVTEDADRNRRLAIAVELAPGEHGGAHRQQLAALSIRTQLCRLNSEFAYYVPGEYQTPHVTLLSAGDPEYFPPGVKHRYTRKPMPSE
jgi:phenylacetate-coenzyme A ligase PaaK-like adenylate-forming protein